VTVWSPKQSSKYRYFNQINAYLKRDFRAMRYRYLRQGLTRRKAAYWPELLTKSCKIVSTIEHLMNLKTTINHEARRHTKEVRRNPVPMRLTNWVRAIPAR
jgi:hypothetical protein